MLATYSLLLLALTAAPASPTAPAEPPTVGVVAVALDRRLETEAAVVARGMEDFARNDPRLRFVDLAARVRARDTRARADRAAQGRAALDEAGKAFESMELDSAAKLAGDAEAHFAASDLCNDVKGWADAVAMRAICALNQGLNREAEEALQRLLTVAPGYSIDPSKLTPEVDTALKKVRASLHEMRQTELSVQSAPAAGLVYVDGVWRGATPLEIKDLQPGLHFVCVASLGYELAQVRALAGPGQAVKAELIRPAEGAALLASLDGLKRGVLEGSFEAPAAAVARSAQVGEVLLAAVQPRGEKQVVILARVRADGALLGRVEREMKDAKDAVEFEQAARELYRAGATVQLDRSQPGPAGLGYKVGGGVLLGVGGVSAVIGIVMGLQAKSQASDAKQVPQLDPDRHNSLASSARTSAAIADACYGLALAGAVAGAVLLAIAPRSASSPGASPAEAPAQENKEKDREKEREKDKDRDGSPELDSLLFVPLHGGGAVALGARF